jgi:hypothetical protein
MIWCGIFIATWYYVPPAVKPSLLRALEEWQSDENPGYLETPQSLRNRIQVYNLKKTPVGAGRQVIEGSCQRWCRNGISLYYRDGKFG